MNGMNWRDFVDSIREAGEPTPFKSPAQKRYKAQRKKNDIYSSPAGHKKLSSGSPFETKTKRAGTDPLRFEEEVEPESFDTHDRLAPEIWRDEEIKTEVQRRLMKIAQNFIDNLPVEVDIEDVRLTGSLANYNWSNYSDVDLHIIVDFLGVDENEPHVSSGVYSLLNRDWVQRPTKFRSNIDFPSARRKADDVEFQVNIVGNLITAGKLKAAMRNIERLKKKIKNMRRAGLESTMREFSVENIAFKILRRNGILGELDRMKNETYDEMMTVREE